MPKEGNRLCFGCMAPLSGGKTCPVCGYKSNAPYDAAYLRPGSKLKNGRYLVGRLLRKNGESAMYLGYDNHTNEACHIREYFPTTLAKRTAKTGAVSPLEGFDAQYKSLISDFMDVCTEVKRLGVTENVIPVRDDFSDNNTFYVVYTRMDVVSYDEYLSHNGGKLPLDKALDLFLPFCNMVAGIHDDGYIHRGISPETIYVDAGENLYLGDFSIGAARTANSELEAELFNGYSAPEQYSSCGWQGAWTDVYALAALFYRTVSGFVPPKSTLIGDERPLTSLDDLVMDIPKNISDAVNAAMDTSADQRTQSVYSFTSKLVETKEHNTAIYDTSRTKALRSGEQNEYKDDGGFKYAIIALVLTAVLLVAALWFLMKTYFPGMMTLDDSETGTSPASEHSQSEPEDGQSEALNVTVPRFIGQMYSVVNADEAYLDRFEFAVKEEYNDDFPEGVIFQQSPEEGTPMPNRGTVILTVSKGPELVTMPNLIGKSFDEALEILGGEDLACERVERYSPGAAANEVVGTTPSPGEQFNPQKQVIYVFAMKPEDPGFTENPGEGAKDLGLDTPESSEEAGIVIRD